MNPSQLYTIAPVKATEPINIKPEFIRLPKPGAHCLWTGLSRGNLRQPVKVVILLTHHHWGVAGLLESNPADKRRSRKPGDLDQVAAQLERHFHGVIPQRQVSPVNGEF